MVDRGHDPVVEILLGGQQDGEVLQEGRDGRIMSALGIHLASRNRIKLWGRMIAGALSSADKTEAAAEAQLVLGITQSLGNCPKYLNKKNIIPRVPRPKGMFGTLPLPDQALQLLAKADLFFMSSHYDSIMGTNHRGGENGFVRVISNDASGTTLVYPEFSGNRLYQTLGNLYENPRTGLVFPDFDTGDVLYVTGTTEIKIGSEAAAILPRSNLVVKIHVVAARFVKEGLSFRAEAGEMSPYNPPVRFLPTERKSADTQTNDSRVLHARLLARDILTPTIARFKFSIDDPQAAGRWKPGQYVALSFEDELSLGYSHMRDDDPKSLNDDYVRTFTISSSSGGKLQPDDFEITIRNVGVVTDLLFRQNVRAGLEVPLKGFGGSFAVTQGPEETVPFVAGGIGITPLLAQLPELDLKRVRLFWSISIHDIGLMKDVFKRFPSLPPSSYIFISRVRDHSATGTEKVLDEFQASGAHINSRRMLASDVEGQEGLSSTWYLCTGIALRKSLLGWLAGKKVVYEDFNY
ncbi:hypothetical protein MMC21_001137 [Puttea exsequens]|nr:hypothetical protein [Puttea exsequens]